MQPLSTFWSAAARLSGAVDFSVLKRVDPSTWSEDQLRHVGLTHTSALLTGPPLQTSLRFLTLADPGYPDVMAGVPYAPGVLFWRGNLDLLLRPGVAIVGARRCTATGTSMARELAGAVAAAGGTVVSGMAYGIDTAAHIAAPGATIAVLGQGLQASLSASQNQARQHILDHGGLILSEFPPHTPARRWTFPKRNRIIAWLSRATVIVEAASRSGSLHTARAALAAGRDVLAVPGHPRTPTAAGCLALIDQGAEIVRDGAELVSKVGLQPQTAAADPLLTALQAGATFDELLLLSNQAPARLLQQLARLELTGRVERLPGDRYALKGARK